jgi:hypothetical protein
LKNKTRESRRDVFEAHKQFLGDAPPGPSQAIFEESIFNVPETNLNRYDIELQQVLDRFRRRRDVLIKDLQKAR